MNIFAFLRHVRIAIGSAEPWCSAILFDLIQWGSYLLMALFLLVCCSKTVRSYVVFILVSSFLLTVAISRFIWGLPGSVITKTWYFLAQVSCDLFDLPSCYCHSDRHGLKSKDGVVKEYTWINRDGEDPAERSREQQVRNSRSGVSSVHETSHPSEDNVKLLPEQMPEPDRNSKSTQGSRRSMRLLPLPAGLSAETVHTGAMSSSASSTSSVFDRAEGASSPEPVSGDDLGHEQDRVVADKGNEHRPDDPPKSALQDQNMETVHNTDEHTEPSEGIAKSGPVSLGRILSVEDEASKLVLPAESNDDERVLYQELLKNDISVYTLRTGTGMPLLQWLDNTFLAELENKTHLATGLQDKLQISNTTKVLIDGNNGYIIVIRHPMIVLHEFLASSAQLLKSLNPISLIILCLHPYNPMTYVALLLLYIAPGKWTQRFDRLWRYFIQEPVKHAWSSSTNTIAKQYIKIPSWTASEEVFPYIEVTTLDDVCQVVVELKALPVGGEPYIAIDMAGVNLGRWGKSCYLSIRDCLHERTWLIDLIQLGKEAFTTSNEAGISLANILADVNIKKMIFDCRQDSHALYHQHNIKLAGIIDLQYSHMLTFPQCPENRPGLFHSLTNNNSNVLNKSERQKFTSIKDCIGKNSWLYEQRPCLEDVKKHAVTRVQYLQNLYEYDVEIRGEEMVKSAAETWAAIEISSTMDPDWELSDNKVRVSDAFRTCWVGYDEDEDKDGEEAEEVSGGEDEIDEELPNEE